MMSMLIGALINTALDPLFIFELDGMTGAALATILGRLPRSASAYGIPSILKNEILLTGSCTDRR